MPGARKKGGIRAAWNSADSAGHCYPPFRPAPPRSPHLPSRQHPGSTHLRRLDGRSPATRPATLSRPPGLPAWGKGGGAAARAGALTAPARQLILEAPSGDWPAAPPPRALPLGSPPNQEVILRRRKCFSWWRGYRPGAPSPACLLRQMGRGRQKEQNQGKGVSVQRVFEKNDDLAQSAGHLGKGSSAQPSGWTTVPRMSLEKPSMPWRWSPGPRRWLVGWCICGDSVIWIHPVKKNCQGLGFPPCGMFHPSGAILFAAWTPDTRDSGGCGFQIGRDWHLKDAA